MGTLLLGLVVVLDVVLLRPVWRVFRTARFSSQVSEMAELAKQAEALHQSLSQRFSIATADMAMRLEQTKGDLRQQVEDRLAQGFSGFEAGWKSS